MLEQMLKQLEKAGESLLQVKAPDIDLPDLPDIDVTSDVKFDNLKIIIQTLVGGIVIFIIIALVAKSDLIGKSRRKNKLIIKNFETFLFVYKKILNRIQVFFLFLLISK